MSRNRRLSLLNVPHHDSERYFNSDIREQSKMKLARTILTHLFNTFGLGNGRNNGCQCVGPYHLYCDERRLILADS
jgi:hypothetical protein